MALGIYEEEDIRALAEEIRYRKGYGSPMTVKQMKDGISEVYYAGESNGYSDGYIGGFEYGKEQGRTEGLAEGKSEAYAEVEPINTQLENTLNGTDTGGKSYYDEFWDNYQDYGKREAYNHAFAYYHDSMFNPKYDIVVKGCAYMFYCATISAEQFNKILQDRKIDFSRTTSVNMVFSTMNCEELPFDIDLSNATSAFEVFAWNGRLKKIKKIIMSENTPIEGWFTHDTRLENLTIEGTIGQNGFNVQWSTKLSKASIISIINALSTTTSGLSVTLSKTAVETAFGSTESEEWIALINTRSNWTINLV